jgi:hypothetical protein
LSSGWTKQSELPVIDGLGNDIKLNSDRRYVSFTAPHYMRSGNGQTNIDLTFTTFTAGGPTITGPTVRSYLFYQYIPITTIQLSAVGSGQVYFFVSTDLLPPGLTFDPLTNQISGTPAQIGKTTTTCYAKDANGVTAFTIDFTVIIPRLIRKQDGAGAYTSLLRQYTDVLGAQNARDNRVLPSQERALGEFMSPQGPDVITSAFDPNCCIPK